jgi:predicted RNase H-like nuclease (RuvC/YqgF family)
MAQVRRENEKLKNKLEARDAEVAKLKEQLQEKNDEINNLKDDNERYQEHSKSPLKAGAVQLQELLMTEHQGSTVMEMLQFCFKDITRNYPKRDDEEYDRSEENFIFEMSPRGLPYDNEHITR